jgi:nicotinamidase-related amidase
VDTTARDASDRGYKICFAEDALADYNEDYHRAALFASVGVCGGQIYNSQRIEVEPTLLTTLG